MINEYIFKVRNEQEYNVLNETYYSGLIVRIDIESHETLKNRIIDTLSDYKDVRVTFNNYGQFLRELTNEFRKKTSDKFLKLTNRVSTEEEVHLFKLYKTLYYVGNFHVHGSTLEINDKEMMQETIKLLTSKVLQKSFKDLIKVLEYNINNLDF